MKFEQDIQHKKSFFDNTPLVFLDNSFLAYAAPNWPAALLRGVGPGPYIHGSSAAQFSDGPKLSP